MIASEAIQLESGRRKGRKNDCARVFDVFPLFSPLYYYLRATLRFFLSFRGLVSILIFLFFSSIFCLFVFRFFIFNASDDEKKSAYQHAYTITATSRQNTRPKTKYDADGYYRVHECIVVYYIPAYLPFFLPLFIPFFSIPTRKVAIAVFSTYLRHMTRGILEICVLYWQWGRRGM